MTWRHLSTRTGDLLPPNSGNEQTSLAVAARHIEAGTEAFDLDGDGDLDVLGKPYSWDAPRLDAWINEGARR